MQKTNLTFCGKNEIGEREFIGSKKDWDEQDLDEQEIEEREQADDDFFAERCENDKYRELQANLI